MKIFHSNIEIPEIAKKIISALPPDCSSVLVTHLADVDEIIDLARNINVTTIQLHGDSNPKDAAEIKKSLPYIKIYKAIHANDEDSVKSLEGFIDFVDGILLDTINIKTDQVGGTGIVHDWEISRKIVESCPKPVILAGGLNPANVVAAIEAVKPFGVDVNSGVKDESGFKDLQKLYDFISRAKNFS